MVVFRFIDTFCGGSHHGQACTSWCDRVHRRTHTHTLVVVKGAGTTAIMALFDGPVEDVTDQLRTGASGEVFLALACH